MNYYKFQNRFSRLKGGETYVEANRGYTMRQMVVLNGEIVASNRFHTEYGFTLPAGYVDYAAYHELHALEIKAGRVEPLFPISQAEFEELWDNYLTRFQSSWEAAKDLFPIGTPVAGPIATYYPQGVLLSLGDGVLGLADSRACRASAKETIFPGHKVSAVVSGYDELNQWILLDLPLAER